jgi:hypothetical protein
MEGRRSIDRAKTNAFTFTVEGKEELRLSFLAAALDSLIKSSETPGPVLGTTGLCCTEL